MMVDGRYIHLYSNGFLIMLRSCKSAGAIKIFGTNKQINKRPIYLRIHIPKKNEIDITIAWLETNKHHCVVMKKWSRDNEGIYNSRPTYAITISVITTLVITNHII